MPLTGRVLLKNRTDPNVWGEARLGFNLRGGQEDRKRYDDEMPQAIVFCQDTQDVVNAVKWARREQTPPVPIRVRSGRHDYEGYSSRVLDGLIIDVSEMDSAKVDGAGSGTVVVGPGREMLPLSIALWEHGRTIPLATGATVGIAGLTLGGGFGVTSRKFGLTCDNLLSIEMVTAAGAVINASESENSDLFWACRGGGGGNFGIVTSLTLKTHPVSHVAMFNVSWPWDHFAALVDRWQMLAPAVKDGISSFLRLSADRKIRLMGQFTPDGAVPRMSQMDELLDPMMKVAEPEYVSKHIFPFNVAANIFFGKDPLRPHWAVQVHSERQIFKSTSAIAHAPFGPNAIKTMREWLEDAPYVEPAPPEPSMVQLLAGGGAVSRKAPDETASFHRAAKFVVQYNSFWTAPSDARGTIAWIEGFREAMHGHASGAYVNYSDEKIGNRRDGTIDKWLNECHGSNLKRLKEVKKKFDPQDDFNFPQSIPLPES